MTLTTPAFDRSRSWWFATRSCKPMARGHPASLILLPIFPQVAELYCGGFVAERNIFGNEFEPKGVLWAKVIPGHTVA